MQRTARIKLVLAFALGGLLAAGALANGLRVPTVHAQTQAATFVGTIPGTDAFIAIASDGHQVIAYVCDGATNNLGDNFNSTIDQATNGLLTLQTGDSSDLLTIDADATTWPGILAAGGSLQGVFSENATDYPFATERAVPPAGLVLAGSQTEPDGSTADGGWIILNDGSVRGSFSTQAPGASQPTNFGQSGTLGQSMQMAPAVMSQVNAAQMPSFIQNLAQVAQSGGTGGTLKLPVPLPSTSIPPPASPCADSNLLRPSGCPAATVVPGSPPPFQYGLMYWTPISGNFGPTPPPLP